MKQESNPEAGIKEKNPFFRKNGLIKFLAAYSALALMGMNIQLLTPVCADLSKSMSLTLTQTGIIMGAISLPGIFLSIPAGKAAEKFGRKAMLITGICLLIPGAVLFPLFRTFEWSAAARIFAGAGCALISVFAPGFANETPQKGNEAIAMGIFNTAIPAGSILTLTFNHAFTSFFGLFESFLLPASISAALAVAFIFIPEASGEVKKKELSFNPEAVRQILPIAAAVLLANFASMGYVTEAPIYFDRLQIPWSIRGTMLSAALWGSLLLAPITGKAISKYGNARSFMSAGLILQGVGLAMIGLNINLTASLIVFTIGAGIIMTPVYVIIPSESKPENIDMSFAIVISAMMIGCLAGPMIAGAVMDNYGFETAFAVSGAFSITGIIFTLIGNKGKKNTTVKI